MRELFSEIFTKECGQRGAQLVATRQYTWVVEDELVGRHVGRGDKLVVSDPASKLE